MPFGLGSQSGNPADENPALTRDAANGLVHSVKCARATVLMGSHHRCDRYGAGGVAMTRVCCLELPMPRQNRNRNSGEQKRSCLETLLRKILDGGHRDMLKSLQGAMHHLSGSMISACSKCVLFETYVGHARLDRQYHDS